VSSDWIFSVLLALYPASFRREYGHEMKQVLAESLRRASSDRGTVGVVSFWLSVVPDCLSNALLEHLVELSHSARSRIVRGSGLAATVGGGLYVAAILTHPTGLVRGIVPASLVCLFAGVLGLNTLLAGRQHRLGRLAFALVGSGVALGFIGMLGSWLGVLEPNPMARVINTGEHAGLVLIGVGLTAWGVVTFRSRALGRLSFAPILVGIFSLAGIALFIPGASTTVEDSFWPLVYGLSWTLLGLSLLTAHLTFYAPDRS